ncbi:MAG: hypothetical protein LQ340_002839, partial [Diploschistes diacapsis]
MGLTDLLSDLWEAVSFTELHAEEPQQQQEDNEQENSEEGGDEEKEKGEEGGEDKEEDSEGGEEEEDGDDEGGDEEEEEEEEEPEDPKPKLEEDCAHSAQCAPMKHHYDACVARVTDQENNPDAHHGKKEDCVEE